MFDRCEGLTEEQVPVAGGLFSAIEALDQLHAVIQILVFWIIVLFLSVVHDAVEPSLWWDAKVDVCVNVNVAEGLSKVVWEVQAWQQG